MTGLPSRPVISRDAKGFEAGKRKAAELRTKKSPGNAPDDWVVSGRFRADAVRREAVESRYMRPMSCMSSEGLSSCGAKLLRWDQSAPIPP